jgi:hypothetical protein
MNEYNRSLLNNARKHVSMAHDDLILVNTQVGDITQDTLDQLIRELRHVSQILGLYKL